MIDLVAYFASNVRAMAPEAKGVAALVPVKLVTHPPYAPVVAYTGVGSTTSMWLYTRTPQ